jgi:hypothetical protein
MCWRRGFFVLFPACCLVAQFTDFHMDNLIVISCYFLRLLWIGVEVYAFEMLVLKLTPVDVVLVCPSNGDAVFLQGKNCIFSLLSLF